MFHASSFVLNHTSTRLVFGKTDENLQLLLPGNAVILRLAGRLKRYFPTPHTPTFRPKPEPTMSEYLTHIAVLDDCRQLALLDPATAPPIRQALTNQLDVSRLGSSASKGDKHTVDLLDAAAATPPSPDADRLFAFFFGWRTHIAADRQMKTLFRLIDPEIYRTPEVDGPADTSILHDLFTLYERYNRSQAPPFDGDVFGQDHPASPLDELFAHHRQANLLGLQQFTRQPGMGFYDWLEKLRWRRQKFYVELSRYDQAWSAYEPKQVRQTLDSHRFYNPDDPLIALALSPPENADPAAMTERLDAAIEQAPQQSHYARALRRSCLYNRYAADYLAGRIDRAELESLYRVDDAHREAEVDSAVHADADTRARLLQDWHENGYE